MSPFPVTLEQPSSRMIHGNLILTAKSKPLVNLGVREPRNVGEYGTWCRQETLTEEITLDANQDFLNGRTDLQKAAEVAAEWIACSGEFVPGPESQAGIFQSLPSGLRLYCCHEEFVIHNNKKNIKKYLDVRRMHIYIGNSTRAARWKAELSEIKKKKTDWFAHDV